MEFQQLRYVVALAQERSFRRAAEKLFVTQPTLSQQVQKLERELHASLFERSARHVKLTAFGESFLPRATSILTLLEQTVGEAQSHSQHIVGTLRIGVIPTIAPYLLPRVLVDLGKKTPKLAVELHDVTTSQVLSGLRESRFDIGLVSLPIPEREFVTRSIGHEPFYLAVSAKHPLATKKTVRSDDLRQTPLLVLQDGHCFRNQSLAYCRVRPQEGSRITFQGSGLASVLAMAEISGGVTFIPQMAARFHQKKAIRFLKLIDPEPKREIGFVWRLTTTLTRAQKHFMDVTEAAFKNVIQKEYATPGGRYA